MSRQGIGFRAPATLPPRGLFGLDPSWSRLIVTPNLDGVGRTWHVLDNGVADPIVTLLCVHGNPTWSYLWRNVLARADPRVRVVAVDQLEMGFSERTGLTRRLTRFVLEEALGQLHRWLDAGLDLDLAVNLSARDLLDESLPETIVELLAANEVPSSRLELEVTQSVILADPL
ncbi:MAG: EAL domain-containing protein, partial [Actinomycetota bacterium]|nr:EAL domain-containing protein [Actinomycetota bacterium]